MTEVWADIGTDYRVSTLGRVAMKDRVVRQKSRTGTDFERLLPGRILSGCVVNAGYLQVCLKDGNGKKTKHYVHRLVGKTFLPNPEGKPQINHKNGNKLDNSLSNLEWATAAENSNHAKDVLGVWPDSSKPVKNLNTGKEFSSVTAAAEFYGMAKGNLSSHLKGRQDTFAKCRWAYVLDSADGQ